jgi:hypothetical protein
MLQRMLLRKSPSQSLVLIQVSWKLMERIDDIHPVRPQSALTGIEWAMSWRVLKGPLGS